jgi:hypothetical protein
VIGAASYPCRGNTDEPTHTEQELDALHAAIESRLDPMERASETGSETGASSAPNGHEVRIL